MLPGQLTRDVIKRLRNIAGQVNGIARMLEEDKRPEQVLDQFKAAKNGLSKAEQLLLNETYRKGLALKIVETVQTCPGNCGNEEKIEKLLREFPDIPLDQLAGKMDEIEELNQWLKEYNQPKKD